mgnify:CR=1 FL=1
MAQSVTVALSISSLVGGAAGSSAGCSASRSPERPASRRERADELDAEPHVDAVLGEQLTQVTLELCELPLIPNGDVFLPEHVPLAREATGCDSLMIARGAMWNASIFAQEPRLRPQREVFARYVALCRQYDNYFGNCKYVAMQMLEGHGGQIASAGLERGTRIVLVLPT